MFRSRPCDYRQNSRLKRKRNGTVLKPIGSNLVQTKIDAGQRDFDPIFCNKCNMVYSKNDSEERNLHEKFHNQFVKALHFTGWKNERVCSTYLDGSRILQVLPSDTHAHSKLSAIFSVMRRDLGTYEDDANCTGSENEEAEDSKTSAKKSSVAKRRHSELGGQVSHKANPLKENEKAFLYVIDRSVAACCVAQAIKRAQRLTVSKGAEPSLGCSSTGTDGGVSSATGSEISKIKELVHSNGNSSAFEKCQLGISRIWVARDARRKGLATRLLDAARSSFYYGALVSKDECAVSDPTYDGRSFAARYFERPDFLVYDDTDLS